MAVFKFDPEKRGLRKTLREYEEIAIRYIWSLGDEGAGSGKTISRASIIFFLNRMVDEGVLGFRDATGKGGHHRIYIPAMDEKAYKKYIVKTLYDSVARDFPEETEEAIKEICKK
jgi:hypothetical protein